MKFFDPKHATRETVERALDEAFLAVGAKAEVPEIVDQGPVGISPTMERIVAFLKEQDKPVKGKDMARILGLSLPTLHSTVRGQKHRLHSHGLKLRASQGPNGGYRIERASQ